MIELIHALRASSDLKTAMSADEKLMAGVARAIELLTQALSGGNRALFCGNGGSAADAQHLAAELSGKFYLDRKALNAEALNINIPFLTAVSNDYDFSYSYARYLEGAAKKGDVLVVLTTSGNSANLVKAARAAKKAGVTTIALTGKGGGELAAIADVEIRIPSHDTPRIQEAQMLVGHVICQQVEKNIFG